MKRGWALVLGTAVALGAAGAEATIVAPGFTVGKIATPAIATGGVEVVGGAVLVGVGPFGGAAQSVVRIDGGGATTIADGFNGLSGFAYDAVNDRLLVGDNSLEAPGAETGDTVYGIAHPLTAAGAPVRARDIALLPAGTINGVADIILDPNDPTGRSLFVSDSFFPFPGPPDGKVWSVDDVAHAAAVLQSGLGFSSGLAATVATLFVGDVDASTFTGNVFTVALPGGSGVRSPFLTGLAGLSDLRIASDGSLLAVVSAFGGESVVLRIDPVTGDTTVVASGFDFASALAEENGVIYVIEGGFTAGNRVWTLTPVPEPATATAVALGCLALAAHRRPRRTAETGRVA
jgi:hypothetical protein